MTLSTSAVAVCCCSDSRDRRCVPQLVEQPRVLDGDDGLGSEVLYQSYLFISERPNFSAVDCDRADHLALLEHRHDDQCANAGKFDGSNIQWSTVKVTLIGT